jgi:hypothetical protein
MREQTPRCSALDELQRGEGHRGAPIAPGLGQAVDDLMRVALLDNARLSVKPETPRGPTFSRIFWCVPYFVSGPAVLSVP